MRRVADNDNSTPTNVARRIDRENLAAGLWLAFLISVGCLLLNSFAESARRDECLMRGAAICMNWSQPRTQAAGKRTGIVEYLKNTRTW
jgi:hypothetical protein